MRVRDLWFDRQRRKTARHPDRGGNRGACRWLACWTGPDGREKTKAFQTREAALKHARRMESDLDRGEYIDPKAGKEKFGPIAEKYLRLRALGATSRQRYESVYRNQVKATFADRAVRSVKPTEVLEWLRSPATGRAA